MGLSCPNCGREYDVTLFEFGRHVECACGRIVTLKSGHIRQNVVIPKRRPGSPRKYSNPPPGRP